MNKFVIKDLILKLEEWLLIDIYPILNYPRFTLKNLISEEIQLNLMLLITIFISPN